jgi:hypothetical protein
VPFFRTTFQVKVPLPPVEVFLSTPGPLRWKLWSDAVSLTTIVYVPAFSFVTFFPPCVSEILNGSESDPMSLGVAADAAAAIPQGGSHSCREHTNAVHAHPL